MKLDNRELEQLYNEDKYLFKCGENIFDCSGAKIKNLGNIEINNDVFEKYGANTAGAILGEYSGEFPMKKVGMVEDMNLFEIEFDGFTSFSSLGIKDVEEVEND